MPDIDSVSITLLLRKRVSSDKLHFLVWGIIAGVSSVLIHLITFLVIYGILLFITENLYPVSREIRMVISGASLVALFLGNVTTSRSYLESYSFTTGTFSNEVVGSNINPIAPDSAHSYVKMITSVLYVGPRAALVSLRMFRSWFRLRSVEIEKCAEIVKVLMRPPGRHAFVEIEERLPSIGLQRLLIQLEVIRGIILLKSDPPGLMLSSEFLAEFEKES